MAFLPHIKTTYKKVKWMFTKTTWSKDEEVDVLAKESLNSQSTILLIFYNLTLLKKYKSKWDTDIFSKLFC